MRTSNTQLLTVSHLLGRGAVVTPHSAKTLFDLDESRADPPLLLVTRADMIDMIGESPDVGLDRFDHVHGRARTHRTQEQARADEGSGSPCATDSSGWGRSCEPGLGRIVPQEPHHPSHHPAARRGSPRLPVEHGRLVYPEQQRNLSLEESEVEAAFSDVVADGA